VAVAGHQAAGGGRLVSLICCSFVLSAYGSACYECTYIHCQIACSFCQDHVLPHISMPAEVDVSASTLLTMLEIPHSTGSCFTLQAVSNMHEHRVAWRDAKPLNVVCKTTPGEGDPELVSFDFGGSIIWDPVTGSSTLVAASGRDVVASACNLVACG